MDTKDTSSSRGLLKGMLVIGSAQATAVLISIAKTKLIAIFLGPSGVGLFGIYTSLQGVVQQTAGLGMGSSAVREIASASEEKVALSRTRRVLFIAHLVQGSIAMIALWLLREPIAIWLFGENSRAMEVGMIGIAILLALLGTAQTALLQGMRLIEDLGRVTVFGAFGGTFFGLLAVWLKGESGLVWLIICQPLFQVLIALNYTRRLPKFKTVEMHLIEGWKVWKQMAKLGVAFMLGGLASAATLLVVRGYITDELGLNAAGHFAAAWSITMTYVGFLLGAMAADFYPRLTEVIDDHRKAAKLMNDQAQLGLAIGGPVLLLLIGLAPWVISMLYSAEFEPAVSLLQWQSLGNVLKLASWALSFSIVAAGRAKTFLLIELSFNIVFLVTIFVFLPHVGLKVASYAFVLGYLVYLNLIYVLVHYVQGFRWGRLSLVLIVLHTGLSALLLLIASFSLIAAGFASVFLAVATGIFGLRVVLAKIGVEGRIPSRIGKLYTVMGWPIHTSR